MAITKRIRSRVLISAYAVVALTAAATLAIKKRKIRRYGVKPFLKRRSMYGQYEKMFVHMKTSEPEEFFSYTRMTPQSFDHLLSLIEVDLRKHPSRRNAIKPEMKLALTLHYLAEGMSMKEISRNYYIWHSTTHGIIRETCNTIWNKLLDIYLPSPSKAQFLIIADQFAEKWNMPHCIGALDGKHCMVQAPYKTGSEYFSYKKSFSIILMATCTAHYKFSMVDIGATGSSHDSNVFQNSKFGMAFLQDAHEIPEPAPLPNTNIVLPYFLVADQAFPLSENIMRPYPGQYLPETKKVFNYRLSRARRTIENTSGILTQRWRCLNKKIVADIDTCQTIIKACVILHNFVQSEEDSVPSVSRKYCPVGYTDTEDIDGSVIPGSWRNDGRTLTSVGRVGANNSSRIVTENRNKMCEYLNSDAGSVEWQLERVWRGAVPL